MMFQIQQLPRMTTTMIHRRRRTSAIPPQRIRRGANPHIILIPIILLRLPHSIVLPKRDLDQQPDLFAVPANDAHGQQRLGLLDPVLQFPELGLVVPQPLGQALTLDER